jgi:TatD DNase family protein
MLFDSHTHLNFPEFNDDYKKIIADCLKKGIGMINVGSNFEMSKRAVEIANKYPNDPIYSAIGLYPAHISETEYDEEEKKARDGENFFDEEKYQKLVDDDKNKKIVAVGEIGLEYSYIPEDRNFEEIKKQQKDGFIKQINFAVKNNLPIILHIRGSKENKYDGFEEAAEILKSFCHAEFISASNEKIPKQVRDERKSLSGVVHCFTANIEIARKFLDLGFYLGFTGLISFKNKSVDEIREVVKMTPLDRILVETDAPYLTPEPFRGEKNTPRNVEIVARKVAELKNVSYEEVYLQTTNNFRKLFL